MAPGDLSGAPLRVAIAQPERRVPGWLAADARDDADVPYRFGDELPFVDRAVREIAVGESALHLARPALLQLLLECRRVLEGGGRLRIAAQRTAPPGDALTATARLAGLVSAPADGGAAFVKPARLASGEPLVTVAIPAYGPRFFAAALRSVLAQTYANLEVVVCDDSRDGAIEAIVRECATTRPIRYLRNAERLGVRGNYVRCFDEATGEFVKFLCDDDLLAPACVTTLVDAFRRVPDLTLATSRRLRIDAAGARLPDQPATLPVVAGDRVIAGWTLANAMLLAGLNFIGEPSTALLRKADLGDQRPACFHFDGVPGHGVIDMTMWAAALLKGDAVYLGAPQSAFRVHAGQRQHDPSKLVRNVASIRALQAAWMDLGLHLRAPPNLLLCKPYPPAADADWAPEAVHSFVLTPAPPSPAHGSAGIIETSPAAHRGGDPTQIEPERTSHHGEEERGK